MEAVKSKHRGTKITSANYHPGNTPDRATTDTTRTRRNEAALKVRAKLQESANCTGYNYKTERGNYCKMNKGIVVIFCDMELGVFSAHELSSFKVNFHNNAVNIFLHGGNCLKFGHIQSSMIVELVDMLTKIVSISTNSHTNCFLYRSKSVLRHVLLRVLCNNGPNKNE